ncbi:MAG: hypothetical protein RJA81_1751 [Planctomycetota bacterium]|jgi:hypothetical protein
MILSNIPSEIFLELEGKQGLTFKEMKYWEQVAIKWRWTVHAYEIKPERFGIVISMRISNVLTRSIIASNSEAMNWFHYCVRTPERKEDIIRSHYRGKKRGLDIDEVIDFLESMNENMIFEEDWQNDDDSEDETEEP